MQPGSSAPGVSQSWQSVTQGAELGAYLQHVSELPLLRTVATHSLGLLALHAGEAALEVGCGTGVFLPLLAEAVGDSGRVVGLDLALAADDSFDAAHCDRVLMHLEDPLAVLREMRRVVKPGGRIVVAEPDCASIVIDAVDHAALQLLMEQAMTKRRHPRIGRERNRPLGTAGFSNRE
jgi:ubiquinone/menaquinone biosynthesis C-methylase UbiE